MKSVMHTKKKMEYDMSKQVLAKLNKKGYVNYFCCPEVVIAVGDRVLTFKGRRSQSVKKVYHVDCAREMWII